VTAARILVVDDEYGVRSGIRQILQIEGYEVDEAATGGEALGLLESSEYDVALPRRCAQSHRGDH
jgi:CheY-like chemotaxis protein